MALIKMTQRMKIVRKNSHNFFQAAIIGLVFAFVATAKSAELNAAEDMRRLFASIKDLSGKWYQWDYLSPPGHGSMNHLGVDPVEWSATVVTNSAIAIIGSGIDHGRV